MNTTRQAPVTVVVVSLPAQGHLNQMLQFSSIIAAASLPVHYVGSAVHNRQAKARINSLNPQTVAGINFHDIPTPPFPSPPPDPNAASKFPSQLLPALTATLSLHRPFAAFLRKLAGEFRRVEVVHDPLMSFVVQDVAGIRNAESYEFVCISAFAQISFICGFLALPFPLPHPKELPDFDEWMPDDANYFAAVQSEPSKLRSGNIFNTSRLIEGPYMEVLEREDFNDGKPCWAIGPILPTTTGPVIFGSDASTKTSRECLEWLDKQAARSVIYVSFGTTVSLSDRQINELAHGLRRSKVKFLWVLRDADKCDVFEGGTRKFELPEEFVGGGGEGGMVVGEWAPQPEILAHRSIGGFMSHCGWNSCIESITMGVAMAAWPMHSDQPSNAALVADVLRTAVVVREWKERAEVVEAARVEAVVRRLMASEEGEEMRKRAEELGAAVRRATEHGGVSRVEFESFLAHITRDDDDDDTTKS